MKSAKNVGNGESKVDSSVFGLSSFTVVLCVLVFCLGGCRYAVRAGDFLGRTVENVAMLGTGEEFAHPGESEADVRRRHERAKRINRQMMLSDIDRALLLDRPSKLTDLRVP